MRFSSIISVAVLFFLYSCNNAATNKETNADTTVAKPAIPPQSNLAQAGTGKLMSMVNNYYELKNAFVAGNATQADEAGKKLIVSTGDLGTYIKTDSTAASKQLQPYLDTVTNETNSMLALKDETCEKKRINFDRISHMMFIILKDAGLKNGGVYREYCPMAFNDKGAYWLSAETEIKNPYFGKKMIECGEVTDSL